MYHCVTAVCLLSGGIERGRERKAGVVLRSAEILVPVSPSVLSDLDRARANHVRPTYLSI